MSVLQSLISLLILLAGVAAFVVGARLKGGLWLTLARWGLFGAGALLLLLTAAAVWLSLLPDGAFSPIR